MYIYAKVPEIWNKCIYLDLYETKFFAIDMNTNLVLFSSTIVEFQVKQ